MEILATKKTNGDIILPNKVSTRERERNEERDIGAWRFSHHWGRTKKKIEYEKRGEGREGEVAEEN